MYISLVLKYFVSELSTAGRVVNNRTDK